MVDIKAIEDAVNCVKERELESLHAAMMAGLHVLPSVHIARPTLLVPVATWDTLVQKYGKQT